MVGLGGDAQHPQDTLKLINAQRGRVKNAVYVSSPMHWLNRIFATLICCSIHLYDSLPFRKDALLGQRLLSFFPFLFCD